MIPLPIGARVWLATGHTDMRRGMPGLALLVQEVLQRDPHGGHVFAFRRRRGDLIKILWHDEQGMCEPCSQNLCKGGRIAGCRQRRRAVEGDVPWKPAT
jgi:transposase